MREFRLVFGATTAATATVLAIFMAGLGVGSAILGPRADRVANPLRLYGQLEIGIAISAAVSPWLIALTSALYVRLGGQESLGVFGATVVRVLLATLVMVVPATLMGGTLPAAVRAVTQASDVSRRSLAVLYGVNTLGAVFGAGIATLFALEYFGTRATLWLGCALGLSIGGLALSVSRRIAGPAATTVDPSSDIQSNQERAAVETSITSSELSLEGIRPRITYAISAVLGFAFFALELVWYRMLAPILGGTAFTFGLILCFALLGIGLGGIAYDLVFRRLRPTWTALAATCACEAVLVILPYALGDHVALLAASRYAAATSFLELIVGWSCVLAIVVLPVAVVSGVQFPLLIALLGEGRQEISQHLGRTYAWNTLGAIAGSLVAGFGALPLLSAPGLWVAISATLAGVALVALFSAPQRQRASTSAIGALVVVTLLLACTPGPTAAWRHGSIGSGRAGIELTKPNAVQRWLSNVRHITDWQADGVECSVAIQCDDGLAFLVNGKSDGSALGDAATQTGAAALGAMLHGDPRSALVIGLGTGESAGWFAQMRNVERVDVVELEPALDEMAARCRAVNWDVLHHPKVRRIYNDGREHLLTTSNTYDAIFSEPSNPYRAGVATLYTVEFYGSVRERLNPGGIFIQWLQAYEIDGDAVLTIVGTVRSVFAHVEVWQTLAGDLQLVCSMEPIAYTRQQLSDRLQDPAIQDALAKAWCVRDVDGFLAHFFANSRWTEAVSRLPVVARNTDDRTLLEYSAAKTLGRRTRFSPETLRQSLRTGEFHRPAMRDETDWQAVEVRRQVLNFLFDGELSYALLERPQDQALVQAIVRFRQGDFAGAVASWPAEYRQPPDDVLRLIQARSYAELGDKAVLDLLAGLETRHPADAAAVRTIYFWKSHQTQDAAKQLELFLKLLHESPWTIKGISETAVALTAELANADTATAERLYPLLCQPFAMYRYDYARQRARVRVAQQLGPDKVVEAFAEYEPNVPWTGDILKARAEAYTATHHPLAERATNELAWFERHESQ